ncbi:unnamed protein product [Discula destructiva]
MGRNKNTALPAAAGRSGKDRHQRAARDNATVPPHLTVLPQKNTQSKHKSYFQIFENQDGKEKKLEYEITTNVNPPPGFDFLPSGNPELTTACKDLSRERGVLMFVVSGVDHNYKYGEDDGQKLALQVHRMGHHFRSVIVKEAKALVGKEVASAETDNWQLPETQDEINAQAEAAMRDLFPRIPNFDKRQILELAFKKDQGTYGKKRVGTSDLPLYRRVQLAVLAHIRHVHTRYDQLLKQFEWKAARKAVERQSLDILVQWRGDEETGRDEMGDILREVIVISDADDDSDTGDSDDSEAEDESNDDDSAGDIDAAPTSGVLDPIDNGVITNEKRRPRRRTRKPKARRDRVSKLDGPGHPKKNLSAKRDKRGFNRYEAAQALRNQRWEEAVTRSRRAQFHGDPPQAPMLRAPSQNVQRSPSLEILSPVHRIDPVRDAHMRPASQPLHDGRQRNGPFGRPVEDPAINYYRQERHVPHAPPRAGTGYCPSEAVVIGRRIGLAPHNPQNSPATGRLHHGELKDFLVPSVEPVSPHSRLDTPQSARQVIWEEQTRPEQVPAGAPRQYNPMESRAMGMAYQNFPVNQAPRPPAFVEAGRHFMPQFESHYERGLRPRSFVAPHEEPQGYYSREPVYDNHHPSGYSMPGAARVVRVHREARPIGRVPESHRAGEFSPRRLEASGRAMPSTAYGPEARRRIVYREASASGLDGLSQGAVNAPARPLYYEVQTSAQVRSWQGSTADGRPQYPSSFQPQATGAFYEGPARRPVHGGSELNQPVHAEQPHRGYSQHGRTPSNQLMRPVVPTDPGDVQYLYEQPAPPPGVIVIR